MKSAQAIIAIVGMPGAGKTVASNFFKNKGIPVLRFGDETERGLREAGLEANEKNERWFREKIRKELGMAAMAIKIEPRIIDTAKTHTIIVLDGLYSWEEYVYLKEKFPLLFLLAVYAGPAIRYQRLSQRPVRPLTQEEAASRDVSEIQNLNKGGPIARADYLIKNDESEEAFLSELERFYKRIV